MLQIIYHPQVQEMLESFHPTVSTTLSNTVLGHVKNEPLSTDVNLVVVDHVAPGAHLFQLPLFRGSILIAFFIKYQHYPVVFALVQKSAESIELTEDELADAQNRLYDCQVNIDRTMPKIN